MTAEEKIEYILTKLFCVSGYEKPEAKKDIMIVLKEAKIKMLEELEYLEYGDFPTKSYSVIHKEFIQKLISELKEEGKEKSKA
jgi:hypothetical protein